MHFRARKCDSTCSSLGSFICPCSWRIDRLLVALRVSHFLLSTSFSCSSFAQARASPTATEKCHHWQHYQWPGAMNTQDKAPMHGAQSQFLLTYKLLQKITMGDNQDSVYLKFFQVISPSQYKLLCSYELLSSLQKDVIFKQFQLNEKVTPTEKNQLIYNRNYFQGK